MGSGLSAFRRGGGGFAFDPMKGMIPLLGLQVAYEYGRPGSARPPVTAALLAANVLVFLRPGPLHRILPRINDVALNYQLFLRFMLWDNLILSSFYHWNELHLFSNMTSLLWMGGMLERHMGSAEFAFMVAILLGLSESIAALLSQCLCFLGHDMMYFDAHSVGFSGVLFGMEAVLGARADSLAWFPGMVIPLKCTVWAELFLTQALNSKSSFIGHLGGILAGYVYIWLKHLFPGRDPLTLLISGGARVVTSQARFAQKLLRYVLPQGHKTGGGRVGCHSSARERLPGLWRCSTCTNYNSLATDVCETCSTMCEDRAFPRGQDCQAWRNGELSVEEMRRRRLDRLDR